VYAELEYSTAVGMAATPEIPAIAGNPEKKQE